jgi:hypothetical protein
MNIFKSNPKVVNYAVALVLLHAVVLLVHGAVHVGEAVIPSPLDGIFIVVVIWIAPFAAIALLKGRRWQLGSLLYVAAMVAALVYEVYYHFVLPGPDNIAFVAAGFWQPVFQISVVLSAIMEVAGTLVGLELLWLSLTRKSLVAER